MEELTAILNHVRAERAKWGDHTPFGANEECLSRISKQFFHEFGYRVDPEHMFFFRLCDGLDNNGYLIYSSGCDKDSHIENLTSANHLWHEDIDKKSYVFIAESGDSLFCYGKSQKKYLAVDRYSLDEYEEFGKTKDLLLYLLKKMISE